MKAQRGKDKAETLRQEIIKKMTICTLKYQMS